VNITHKQIAWFTTAVFILFSILGNGPSTYRFAVFFLGPFLWAVYFARNALCITRTHYALFALALVIHNLGAFGTYGKFYFGFEFDTYVHYFFGFAGAFLAARALACRLGLTGWKMWIGTVLVIMGIGALHELMEYVSTLALGPEKGMLKVNDPDRFDTQKDLGNNLLGVLTALSLYSLFHKRSAEPST
jgi:uncharacterized membrane protein YjdF